MAIIGLNDDTSLAAASQDNTGAQIMVGAASFHYTAGANEEAFRFGIRIGGVAGAVSMALYDVTSGVGGGTLVYSEAFTPGTTGGWNTKDFTTAQALTSGNTYSVAVKVDAATNVSLMRRFETGAASFETLTGASSFPATWSEASSISQVYGIYIETQAAGGTTIIVSGAVSGSAPVLTDPLTISSKTSTSITASYVTDTGSGVIYAVAVPTGDTEPSQTQLKAGTDALDAAAPNSVTVLSATSGNLNSITGLDAGTTYDIYAYQDLA